MWNMEKSGRRGMRRRQRQEDKKKRRRGWEEGQRDKGEASRAKWKGKEERRRETKRTLMRTWHLVTEGFNI